jgi:hypothetical protein
MGARRKKEIKAHKLPLAAWKLAALGLAAAFCAAMFAYGPALTGPFVFDDTVQLYAKAAGAAQPLLDWVNGERPMLFFSFWLNHLILGNDPFGYHLVNVIIHVFNAAVVFLLYREPLRDFVRLLHVGCLGLVRVSPAGSGNLADSGLDCAFVRRCGRDQRASRGVGAHPCAG